MIVVDTNVISELMRREPHPAVMAWMAAQRRAELYTTRINQAEILYGIAALPEGQRRATLHEAANAMFEEDFAGQSPAVRGACSRTVSGNRARRRQTGTPIDKFDALIAAVALAAGADIATRDTGGFAGCGLMVIDPWAAS